MNPLFYPSNSKARESKSGLEKHRKIYQYTDSKQNEAIRNNIPDSWFYNNKNANKVWESLEVDPAIKFEPTKETDSPFKKIDESANRIRQMITSYEISDQELLVNLMDILEQEDEFYGNYHDDDALFEAKLRLGSMINDHSGNTDAQEKMLDSLREWFDSLTKKSQTDKDGDSDIKTLKDTYNVDVTQLAEMINSSFETREMNSEQLQMLHRSVVDNLTRQIRDMRRKITEQEETIDELNKTIEAQKNFRKRQLQNLKKDEKDIMNYQRTICEKDAKIIDLKSTITEIAGEAKTSRQIPQNVPPPSNDDYQNSENEIASSIERDFEYDTRIRSMSETISSLKQELNESTLQLRKEKQNSFQLENKFQLLDRTKKSIEQTLSSTNERYALLEKKLKDKADELEKLQKSLESSAVIEAINETKKEYEEKIQDLIEINRANVSKAIENVEKRYKKQMSELMKALNAGETQTAINELNNQHLNEITIIKKECQDEIENLRLSHGSRLNLLTKHYETKIAQLLNDNKKLQESIERDLEIHVEEKRIEIEEDFARKMIDFQDKAATDLSDLKNRFESKIGRLEVKLHNVESERDTLKGIIEDNELLDELPSDFNETNIEDNGEDDVLADSILQLKKREIEKSVSEKYSLFLKSQRQCIEQAKNWEIEKIKVTYQSEMDEKLLNLRSGIMENLCQLRIALNQKENTEGEEVDQLIVSTLQMVESHDSKMRDTIDKQFIPLNEVESRLAESNEKINDLSGENEFLRFTLKQLNNGKDLVNDNNDDLIRAMRSSIAEQANQISQTLREYNDMKARIEYYEQKGQNHQLSDELIQTDEEPKPICVKKSFLIFSREEMKISKEEQSTIKDDDIVLIDNSNASRAKRQRSINKSSSQRNTNTEPITNTELLIDISTQTDSIPIVKSKKKVKKAKNSESSTQKTTANRSPNPEQKEIKENNQKQQQPNEETKLNNNDQTQNESQQNKENENKPQINKQKQITNTDENEEEEDKMANKEEKISDKKDQNNNIKNNEPNNQQENNTNHEQTKIINNDDDEYEYEYDDNYPQFIQLTRLSFTRQNCIFEVNPDGHSDAYVVECPNCHQNVPFDPHISEVSTTVDPVIECPHCHNSVTIDKEKYPVMFRDDYCNVENSLSLSPEERSQIASMEESIQKQVQDLIQKKQELIKEQNSNFRSDLEPSLPTAILSLPKSETDKQMGRTIKYNQNSSTDLQVSQISLAIEIPGLKIESSISSRANSSSTLSSRSFVSKFDQNDCQINSAEQKIDQEISKLIEYKQELLSKKSSSKNSIMNSDNEDSTSNSTKPSTRNTSRKLKLEEMPPNEGSTAIENIASDLQMNDVQLQRAVKASENEKKTNSNQKVVSFTQNKSSSALKIQSSSNYFLPLGRTKLTISESVLFDKAQVQKAFNDYLKSLAIQTVSEIDVSIENSSTEPIKKLETIEKAVLTLSNLNAFSSSDQNQQLASNIIQKAQSLKDIEPSMIPTEEVEEVVQSARKLLVSLCRENELEQVNIKPLSEEAGGFLTDDIEKLRNENLKFKNEIVFINEKQTKLKEEIQDLNESAKELKLKHEEIIFSLQKLIDNIINSIQKGEGTLDSNSLNTLKDQAKYLMGSIKEKENLEADNKETNQLLKERDIEIISLNHTIQNKEGQIQDLSTKLANLTSQIENINLHNEGQQFNVENLEKLDKENKKVIEQMSDALFKMKDNSDQLQKKLDQLEITNQQLQNKIVMRESYSPVDYSFISPFIIFDTQIMSSLPSQGFTLIPGKNKYDQIPSQKESNSKDENGTETIRVKYNQTNQQPKLIVPKTSQARSRQGAKNPASNQSSRSQNHSYVDLVPVHGEDPKSFIYVRKAKMNEYTGYNGGSIKGYLDRNPITGNVVLQKTVTNLNRRIYSLQSILQSKAHEMIKLRDQKNESRQNLYKTVMQLQRTQKDLVRAQTNLMLNNDKLNKAFKLIEERDAEIRQLRDLIRQLRTAAAQPALMHQVMSNIAEDQSNLAAMRAFRSQTTLNEMSKSYDVNSTLKRFAQRQVMVVKKWEKRRKELIRQQQSHLLAVLAGMSLIAIKDKGKKDGKKEILNSEIDPELLEKISARKVSITVTPMQEKKRSKASARKSAPSDNRVTNSNKNTNFDSSWKNANSRHPKIPPGMKDGIVAQPL